MSTIIIQTNVEKHEPDKGITKITRSRAYKSISLHSNSYANTLSSVQSRHVMPQVSYRPADWLHKHFTKCSRCYVVPFLYYTLLISFSDGKQLHCCRL